MAAAAGFVVVLIVAVAVSGGGAGNDSVAGDTQTVTVYSSPTCGCCEGYAEYLKDEGFRVELIRTEHVDEIKDDHGIPEDMRSCHTAVLSGYYIEGHVPVEAIRMLLEERPEIDGIALPGMPAGSPGMGGEKEQLFIIYSIADGLVREFVTL